MPKVRSLDPVADKDKKIYALIKMKQIELSVSDMEISKRSGMSTSTFLKKKKHPHLYHFGEMQEIVKVLKFTDEEKAMCL